MFVQCVLLVGCLFMRGGVLWYGRAPIALIHCVLFIYDMFASQNEYDSVFVGKKDHLPHVPSILRPDTQIEACRACDICTKVLIRDVCIATSANSASRILGSPKPPLEERSERISLSYNQKA
jgi:hypothetical protein